MKPRNCLVLICEKKKKPFLNRRPNNFWTTFIFSLDLNWLKKLIWLYISPAIVTQSGFLSVTYQGKADYLMMIHVPESIKLLLKEKIDHKSVP